MANVAPRGPLPLVVLDEIALEGLEGITLPSLWVYISAAIKLPLPLSDKLQRDIWLFIKSAASHLQFYELPKERATVTLRNRYEELDTDFGVPLSAYLNAVRYKCTPIQDGDILGSCECYKERKNIPIETLRDKDLENVLKTWGNRFAIVASQSQRMNALTPANVSLPKDLSGMQYCLLEAIGRARYNGETTSGSCSLLDLCKDSAVIFYIKNKLVQRGLVAAQPYTEKCKERFKVSTLLMLPRFYTVHKSMHMQIIEKVYQLLKEAPEHRLSLNALHSHFPSLERRQTFKKLTLTHEFTRFFELQRLPPSEQNEPTSSKKKDSSKERFFLHLSLRDPNLTEEALYDDGSDSKNDDVFEFYDEKHSYVDMPLKDEFYRAIVRHGARGCSQAEICNYFCMNHLAVRQLTKKFLSDGLLVSYVVDVGRQRINRYVAVEFAASVKKAAEAPLEALKLQCSEAPNIPKKENTRIILEDLPNVFARVKPFKFSKASLREANSQKQVARKTLIMKTVNEKSLVDALKLRLLIMRTEREQGYKDEMCQKSLQRLLHFLNESKNVNIYEITLKYEEHARIHRYVTHPKIDLEHELLQREVISLKHSLYLTAEERRQRNEAAERERKKKAEKCMHEKTQESKSGVQEAQVRKPPKFLMARYMHEFLFYTVVELNEHQQPLQLTEDMLQHWQQTEPSLQVREFLQQLNQEEQYPMAYTQDISWHTFIPPLSRYPNKPTGWAYFLDLMERIPLYIFNKIFRIEQAADPSLIEYLTHPVRQYYLMGQLPAHMRAHISRLQQQKMYSITLKLLNNIGLIQVNKCPNAKDPMVVWVYLNRYAQVVDTTSSEASFSSVNPERKYPVTLYTFNSLDNVQQYWSLLHRVCVYTKLGFKRGKYTVVGRSAALNYLSSVDFDEAPVLDSGNTPGDHMGAGGTDTRLFAHRFRNWSWLRQSVKNMPASSATSMRSINRHASGASSSRKKPKLSVQLMRMHATKLKTLPSSGSVTGGVGISSYQRISAKKSRAPRDAVDRDALKNMRTLRVSWCAEEVELLKISRAVYKYVCAPVPMLGLLTAGRICRDIIRRSIGVRDKTMQACVRRMQFMVRTRRHLPEVPAWVHLLQTNEAMQRQYGDCFLERLAKVYPNRSEYCEALAKHFVLIMLHLYRIVHNPATKMTKAASGTHFSIPDTLSEFQEKFLDSEPDVGGDRIKYSNPSNEFELQVVVVLNVLHSSLCCQRDKALYHLHAFEIYKNFSELVLEHAFQKARSDALVVALRRKQIHLVPTQLAGPAYALSNKYRQRLIFTKIPYHVYEMFYRCFEKALETFFAASSSLKGSQLELKSPHVGQLFFICEGLVQNYWQASVKLPVSILTVDTEQPQSMDRMDRILDHYHTILDNAPQTEYAKDLESEPSEKQARVKFHSANLLYKIYYTPYDVISKLPTRVLHFFCALDHLLQEVDINFSKLQRTVDEHGVLVMDCPFSCIMRNANYMNAIERIVQEKREVLSKLGELPPQKLLNLAASGETVEVQVSNLLTLVQMLETWWREKETAHESKDLGKVAPNLRRRTSTDWQQLCKDILECSAQDDPESEKIDEYEPTLNKEERLVRAQDVFVVNLPTLCIAASAKLSAEKETVLHNKLMVPKVLLAADRQRESILQKIYNASYWKYTEQNFTTLKAQLKNLNFNVMEQRHLEEVHNFIESYNLGVSVADLLLEFPYKDFLLRALHCLEEHLLIKRVGVASFMYVHKTHIRPWVVHTFHLKRLERENLGGDGTVALKRKHEAQASTEKEEEENETPSKKAKSTETTNTSHATDSLGKRVHKAPKRFESKEDDERAHKSEVIKDTIVMRPQPWMRLNGSINRRVLDRWLGTILMKCVASCGCSMLEICLQFPHMLPVDVMFLLEVLRDLKCIKLTQLQVAEVTLFSEYEPLKESEVSDLYDPTLTYVTTNTDAILRMANFIGPKKYNMDFI